MSHQKFTTWAKPVRWTAAGCLLLVSACGTDPVEEPNDLRRSDQYAAALTGFASCDDLDSYLADVTTEMFAESAIYDYGYTTVDVASPGRAGGEDTAGDLSAPTAEGGGANGGADGPTDFTTTNVQEVGIDEPDMTKTNGQYTYVLQGGTLHVLDSFPVEDTHEVATLAIGGYTDSMFLVGDTVVTFHGLATGEYHYDDRGGMEPGRPEPMPAPEPMPDDEGGAGDEGDSDAPFPGEGPITEPDPLDDGTYFEGVRVTIVDVSTPDEPTITRRFDVEGQFTTARLVDGTVYLVHNSQPWYMDTGDLEDALMALDLPTVDYDASDEDRLAARDAVYAAARPLIADWIASGGRDAMLPDLRTEDGRTELFNCTDLMRPEARAGLAVLGVVGFEPTADAAPRGAGVIADGWQVYGSSTSMYIAQDSRWWSWFDRDQAYAETQIHRFLLGDGAPSYAASGSVPGWTLNQFSMSEYDGFLRVATTDQTNWGWGTDDIAIGVGDAVVGGGTTEPSTTTEGSASSGGSAGSEDGEGAPPQQGGEQDSPDEKQNITRIADESEGDANNIFVLEQSGRSLEIVSGIRGIAPTERIYAVRFLGERGFVVTFRQTDPLYTIDLSDPRNPVIEGELHIPGFSTYLHPFGDDYLIGVGRDGTDDGRITDFQIQMFDVSDPTNPTRIHQEVLSAGSEDGWGWSYSEAEHDHRAFTFYASQNLLAVPVTLEDYSGDWDSESYSHFSGIIVYRVSAEDGFVEVGRVSHSFMPFDRYCLGLEGAPEGDCAEWTFPWYVNMRRSTFIDDYLLAISDQGVTASAISDLDEILATVGFE